MSEFDEFLEIKEKFFYNLNLFLQKNRVDNFLCDMVGNDMIINFISFILI